MYYVLGDFVFVPGHAGSGVVVAEAVKQKSANEAPRYIVSSMSSTLHSLVDNGLLLHVERRGAWREGKDEQVTAEGGRLAVEFQNVFSNCD